jgi:hypothetical protein
MNRFGCCFVILLILILGSQPCNAERLKAYVTRFSVCSAENRDELNGALQTLLMSRLNSEQIQAIENQSEAEILIAGSYIVFGTVFSLDAVIRTSSGAFIDRVFVQGDTQNELIPSVAEMARQLQRAILVWKPTLAVGAAGDTVAPTAGKSLPVVAKKERPAKPEAVIIPKESELPEKTWVSQKIPGTMNNNAGGWSVAANGTEIFISGDRTLRYYRKARELKFLSEVAFEADEKIIGIDLADLDHDGTPEIYVSLLKGVLPVSQVYVPDNSLLRKIGDNIPYLLRAIALEGKENKIFAQKTDAGGNFTGDIYELIKSGDDFVVRNPMQLPLFGNLYNFNKIANSKGKGLFIVSHPDGYLLVYSKEKKQLWKSRDKFGGSENSLCPSGTTGSSTPCKNLSLPQRLLVTPGGNVIVARNTGLTTDNAMRHYSKNNVVQLSWNGSSLQEKWRSEQSPNYLADFAYDDLRKELLLLEVEPHGVPSGERGSRLVVQKLK